MSGEAPAPKLGEWFRQKVFRRFGMRGLLVLAFFGGAIFVWSQWVDVRTWPGVDWFVARLNREAIPQADPRRYSVLVANLENDPGGVHEQHIIEALKEFEGVQVLVLDRTIAVEGTVPEEQERTGHDQARDYLAQSGASVLIWGTVLGPGGKTVPKLYWTTSQPTNLKPGRYEPVAEAQLRLPQVFWSDLDAALRLLVVTGDAAFRGEEGQYVADRLSPFIDRVRTLLAASADRPGWDADARASTRRILADSLARLGEQIGQNAPINDAVVHYREILSVWTRERVPLDWAMTQNNLGLALWRLGERESGTARLEDAVKAYRLALEERTREGVPLDWAGTQSNLGLALMRLGERESGTARLEDAVKAYRAALAVFEAAPAPYYAEGTRENLGGAEALLAERRAAEGAAGRGR